MKKEPTKYPAFMHLNAAWSYIQKAFEEGTVQDFGVTRRHDGAVITGADVIGWLNVASEHYTSKAEKAGWQPPHREGFGPGPRDAKGRFKPRYRDN